MPEKTSGAASDLTTVSMMLNNSAVNVTRGPGHFNDQFELVQPSLSHNVNNTQKGEDFQQQNSDDEWNQDDHETPPEGSENDDELFDDESEPANNNDQQEEEEDND